MRNNGGFDPEAFIMFLVVTILSVAYIANML